MHQNIKPENILVVDTPDDLTIKLVDYDYTERKIKNKGIHLAYNPSFYISPDMLNGATDSDKNDVWSIGAIVYTLIQGEPPFYSVHEEQRKQKILKGDFEMEGPLWYDISEECKDFIAKSMAKDKIDRLNPVKALAHSWFKVTEYKQVLSLEKFNDFHAQEKLK